HRDAAQKEIFPRLWYHGRAIHVPGVGTVQQRDGSWLPLQRRETAPARPIAALPPGLLLPRRPRVVVDDLRVGGNVEPRPVVRPPEALTDSGRPTRTGNLDCLEIRGAQGGRRSLHDIPRVLRGGGSRRQTEQDN